MKILLDKGAKMPTRAHAYDAGLDLYAPYDVLIPAKEIIVEDSPFGFGNPRVKTFGGFATIDTGVHVEIPEGYVGLVKSKSGLMCNHGIITDGTMDAHYTGPH